MGQRPLAEGVYRTVDGAPRLIGGRRRSDGKYAFPLPQGPQGDDYEAVDLAAEGVLWSYTVQRFRPKTPYAGPGDERSFTPYAVGYVELPGEIIVESHIAVDDFNILRIGMPVRFTLIPFRQEADGTLTMIHGFTPAGADPSQIPAGGERA